MLKNKRQIISMIALMYSLFPHNVHSLNEDGQLIIYNACHDVRLSVASASPSCSQKGVPYHYKQQVPVSVAIYQNNDQTAGKCVYTVLPAGGLDSGVFEANTNRTIFCRKDKVFGACTCQYTHAP